MAIKIMHKKDWNPKYAEKVPAPKGEKKRLRRYGCSMAIRLEGLVSSASTVTQQSHIKQWHH